jgi:tRNA(Arg) A34 adenosine deaminase TadA
MTISPRIHHLSDLDLRLLRQAIALSAESRSRKRHPFAALVADREGNVWVECFNDSKPPTGDPTCHAERLAAAQAARVIPAEKLAECTLYTSAEPCAMCAGAIYWCGIGRVVYGLSEERLLTLTGDDPENPTLSLPCREVFTHGQRRVEVHGPLLEDEAAVPHHQFWRPAAY